MRKILILALSLFLVAGAGVFAQSYDMDTMSDSFESFSGDVAAAIPFASTTGLNWSDAKVRGFPHFGAGISVEAAMMPAESFEDLADSLTIDLPSGVTSSLGVPIPGYAFDARVGIPFLPIDVGAKFGVI